MSSTANQMQSGGSDATIANCGPMMHVPVLMTMTPPSCVSFAVQNQDGKFQGYVIFMIRDIFIGN